VSFLTRQSPEHIASLFERQREHHRLGYSIHVWAAVLTLIAVAGPTTATEAAAIPISLIFFARLPGTWRLMLPIGGAWITRLYVIFGAWWALSLAWSPDWRHGLLEFGTMRFAATALMLWPVLDRRRELCWALAAGFLLGNLSQLAHAIGTHCGIAWLTWHRLPDRNSGWWDPVVGGSLLCGALGLHLPGALLGAGRERALHVAGAVVTLAAVFATGTRGAWLASAALVTLCVGAALWITGPRLRTRGLAGVGVVVFAGVLAGAWLGPGVARRAERGYDEVRAALDRKDFSSDTGARLLLNWWAIEAWEEHPVRGVGAGGYRPWVIEHLKVRGIDPATRAKHAHAHDALLHAAATTGLVGAALLGTLVICGIVSGRPRRAAGESWALDAGPAAALLGLVLVSAFDTIQVNAQTAALMAVLLGLCPSPRPPPARVR
jgi:O-antigen ligase